jgi:ankyrin repeat protein
LIVELSKNKSIELVERNQIDRIFREQRISIEGKSVIRAAETLGAHGLLLLNTIARGTNRWLTARLIAVKPSVVLDQFQIPALTNSLAQSEWIAQRIAPLFPKLLVLPDRARRISIVNLRTALNSRQSIELERQLKALLTDRLVRQPEIFVLEREHMELLADEKEFRGLDETPFWNGAYLLEGSIDRDGYSPATVTLNARLVPPNGPPVTIDLATDRTNVVELLEKLTGRVLAVVKPGIQAPPWNAGQEAEQYFSEAQWAHRWSALAQAQGAVESSWALGKQSKEVAELRVRIYHEQAIPVWPPNVQHKPTPENSAPDVAKLKPALRAMQIANQAFAEFLTPSPSPQVDTNWFDLSVHLLADVSDLLRQFYLSPPSRIGHEDDLLELRALTREFSGRLADHAAYRHYARWGDHLLIYVGNENGAYPESMGIALAAIQAARAPYWLETPDDALELYRQLAQERILPRVRELIAVRPLIGWSAADRARADGLWRRFVDESCGSTNMLTRVEGFYLAYALAKKDPNLEMSARTNLYQAAVDGAPAYAAYKLNDDLRRAVHDIVPDYGIQRDHDLAFAFLADFDHAVATGQTGRRFESMKEFLNAPPALDAAAVKQVFSRGWFIKKEARELHPLFEKYYAILLEQQQTLTPSDLEAWRAMTNAAAHVKTGLEVALRDQPPSSREKPRSALASTNVLRVARFWPIPRGLFHGDHDTVLVEGALSREGWLWLSVNIGNFGPPYDHKDDQRFVIRVNPRNFEYQMIPIPRDRVPSRDGVEVSGGFLYTANPDHVSRYSIVTKTWETLDVPTPAKNTGNKWEPPYIALRRVGEKLIIATDESIMHLAPDGKSVEILASRRRNPPVNILDAVPSYRASRNLRSAFAVGPNNSLRVVVGTNLYAFDAASKEWSLTTPLPMGLEFDRFYAFDEGLVYRALQMGQARSGEREAEWWFVRSDAAPPELILQTPPSRKSTARWLAPTNLPKYDLSIDLHDGELWAIQGRLTYENFRNFPGRFYEENGRHATLLRFTKSSAEPEIFALRFEIDPELIGNDLQRDTSRVTRQGSIDRLEFAPTLFHSPYGLMLVAAKLPGVFLIPTPGSSAPTNSMPRNIDEPITPNSNLFAAAESGDVEAARAAIAAGAKVDARNDRTWTPLMVAAKNRRAEVAQLLMDAGADVNAQSLSKLGNTVLAFAAAGGDPEIVRMALDHGAAANARSGPNQSCSALFYAVTRGNLAAVEVLVSRGANANDVCRAVFDGDDATMLMLAADHDHAAIIGFLLDKGASIDVSNGNNDTALMFAARAPSASALKTLIDRGANIHCRSKEGHTPLFYAAYNGRCDNIDVLLAAGADPLEKSESYGDEYDVAEIAARRHFPEAAAILRRARGLSSAANGK